jgi:hypothetical protein
MFLSTLAIMLALGGAGLLGALGEIGVPLHADACVPQDDAR